jgi:hypothetical protein
MKVNMELSQAQSDALYFRQRLEAWQDANRDMGDRFAAVLEQRVALATVLREVMNLKYGEAPNMGLRHRIRVALSTVPA